MSRLQGDPAGLYTSHLMCIFTLMLSRQRDNYEDKYFFYLKHVKIQYIYKITDKYKNISHVIKHICMHMLQNN